MAHNRTNHKSIYIYIYVIICILCIFFEDGLIQFILGVPAKVYPFSLDYLGPHGTDSVPGKGTTRPYIPQLDPHLSPATREENCCSKFQACIFQPVLLSPGACMHLKNGGGYVHICFTYQEKHHVAEKEKEGEPARIWVVPCPC